MDASVELRIQTLDNMLSQRKQLLEAMRNLGMYGGYDYYSEIAFYQPDNFFRYAEILGVEVRKDDYDPGDGSIHVFFSYNGYTFSHYLHSELIETYADRIRFLPKENGNV